MFITVRLNVREDSKYLQHLDESLGAIGNMAILINKYTSKIKETRVLVLAVDGYHLKQIQLKSSLV